LTVAITPDGQFAVSGSKDKTLKLWDVVRGTELNTLTGHTSFVNSVAITSNAQLVLSGSWGVVNGLCLWDLAESKRYTLAGSQRINAVAMTPDGQIALSGSDNHTLTLWDCSGIPLRILKGHAEAINAVAMTPDGRVAISGSKDKTLKLWDLTNGVELKTLTGHTELSTL
jgi:WD40 repeat protein